MRRVVMGAVLAFLVAWSAHAEPMRSDQRILFTPTPLGGESAVWVATPAPQPRTAAVPRPRPVARPAHRNAGQNRPITLSKTNLDLTAHPLRATSLSAPQPRALDFSRGVDLGGVSLGLETNRDNGSGSGGTGLVTLDTKTPIPADPALATRQGAIPYLGLSLSAPTN